MKNKKWIGMICTVTLMISTAVPISANSGYTESATAENLYTVSVVSCKENVSTEQEVYGVQDYEVPKNIKDIGDASVQNCLSIDGRLVALYPEFDDSTKALQNAKKIYTDMIEILQNYYGLEEMTEKNWQEYRTCMWKYLDEDEKVEWYTEDNASFAALDTFFDIYENTDQNAALIKIANSADSVVSLLKDTEFVGLLPWNAANDYANALAEMANSSSLIEKSEILSLSDISSAVTYAENYAENYNTSYEYVSGADCTNFASQIMVAGGKSKNINWNAYKVLSKWIYTYGISGL